MKITIATKKPTQSIFISWTNTTDTTQVDLTKHTLLLGVKEKPTALTYPLLVRNIARTAKSISATTFCIDPQEWRSLACDSKLFLEQFAYELANGAYEFERYKKEVKEQTLTIITSSKGDKEELEAGLLIAEELNDARELINTPGSHFTPKDFAEHARKEVKGIKNTLVQVLDVQKMRALKMNAVLAVGESSPNKPVFIVVEYKGGKKTEKPIVFVGKGVTFDTGGSNIKPGDHMNGMHMDMAGGAVALHSLVALAKLGVKKNIIALIPAVENRVTGDSYLPGDVIVGMSGQAIEVLNTDAEGRVILSDALTYAERYTPELVIDVATLTGAAVVALGSRASALFSPDDTLTAELKRIGETTKNLMWPLPLYDEYKHDIKGDLGGITNTHNKMKRDGGSITGAMFLYQFAQKYPWVHIDIAPRMESIAGDNLAPGATAEPLYALVVLARTRK